MSENERFVVVDDRDPSLRWDGPWFDVETTRNSHDWNNRGPPFLNTLKGISTDGSLSFSFRGTSVYVYGSLSTPASSGNTRDPDWECFIDGNSSDTKHWEYPDPNLYISNYEFCSRGDLADGDHVLEMRAMGQSDTRLWMDYILYQASPDVNVSSSWTQVSCMDGRFQYSGNWEGRDFVMSTRIPGASFIYEFDGALVSSTVHPLSLMVRIRAPPGEAIILGGSVPGNASAQPGLGTYSLDLGPPIEFVIPRTTFDRFNQPHFNLTTTPGTHRLEVVNKGNELTAALAFSYIYTQNTPAGPPPLPPSPSPSSPPPPPSTPTATEPPKSGSSSTITAIGGAVGGGLALVVLAVLLVIAIKRNRRRNREDADRISPLFAPGPEGSMAMSNSSFSDRSRPQEVETTPGRRLSDYRRQTWQLQNPVPQPPPPQFPVLYSPPPSYVAPSSPPPTFYTGDYDYPPSPGPARVPRSRRSLEKAD